MAATNFISSCQFGFRKGSSTALALIHKEAYITQQIENGNAVAGIYLDVEKCFDTVDPKILGEKLADLRFSGSACSLIVSYLTNRLQQTKNGECYSEFRVTGLGCPQGSALSPTLFLIYINSLFNIFHKCKAIGYADDITLLFSIRPDAIDIDTKQITIELKRALNWYVTHRLCINVNKTALVIYRSRQRNIKLEDLKITLEGRVVKPQPTVSCLGVQWDEHLSWKPHIDNVTKRCKRAIAALARLRNIGIPKNIGVQVYRALIESLFTYCIVLFGNTSKTHMYRLQVAQNNAIRAISRTPARESVRAELRALKIRNMQQLYIWELGKLAYKNFNNRLVPEMTFHFDRPLRTGRSAPALYIPACRLELRYRATDLELGRLWARWGAEVESSGPLNKFLVKLDKYIESMIEQPTAGYD